MPDTRMVVIRWQTDRGIIETRNDWPERYSLQECAEEQAEALRRQGVFPIRPLRGITCIVPVLGGERVWILAREKQRFPVALIREVLAHA